MAVMQYLRAITSWTTKCIFSLLFFVVTTTTECFAEVVEKSAVPLNPPPVAPPVRIAAGNGFVSSLEMNLSIAVLVFGALAMLLQFALMWKAHFEYNAVLKVMAVILVITGTLFLITAGYSADQIAPAMGLFGTITGYLLGRETTNKDSDAD